MIRVNEDDYKRDYDNAIHIKDFVKKMENAFRYYFPKGTLNADIRQDVWIEPQLDESVRKGDDILTLLVKIEGIDNPLLFPDDYLWLHDWKVAGCINVIPEDAEGLNNAYSFNDRLNVMGTPKELLDAWEEYCSKLYKTIRKLERRGRLSDKYADSLRDL